MIRFILSVHVMSKLLIKSNELHAISYLSKSKNPCSPMLSANQFALSSLNASNEHATLTLLAKSLTSPDSTWNVNDLGAQLEDFLGNILPTERKLPIAYFSCLSAMMERLMNECKRSCQLQANQIRGLQFALLQRVVAAPVAVYNLLPLIAVLRDIQLLSTAARDRIVEGFLQKLSGIQDEQESKQILSDLPIIFHHLLQLGDAKQILPIAQLWMSRGAKEVADHLLFLAGQGSKVLDVLFKSALKSASLDPLTFALLLQSTRLPGISLNTRAARQVALRQFIVQLQSLHDRHAQLRSAPWCPDTLPLPLPRDFLLQVAHWLPDSEQSILAAIELAEAVKEAAWLEEMFCCRPFARRELMRRAGRMFSDWPRLMTVDAEIVGEFFPEKLNPFLQGCLIGTEYALGALKAAPLSEALKEIKAAPAEALPLPHIEDWTALDDAEEAELISALLIRKFESSMTLDDELNAQLFGLCELLWLDREACPLDEAIRIPLCALAVDFACRQQVEESRLGAFLAVVEGGAIKLFPSTASSLLSRATPINRDGPLFTAAMEAIEDWSAIADLAGLPATLTVMKSLTRLQIPFNSALQTFIWTAAEQSISQPATFTKLLIALCESVKPCTTPVTVNKASLAKLEAISDPGLIKALSKLLCTYGDAGVFDEMIKAVIIHFGAVEGEENKDESPFGNLSSLTTALRGSTMNTRASEALFLALIGHFADRIAQLDWLLQAGPQFFITDWQEALRQLLPIDSIRKSCFALSTGNLAFGMQNMLASLYLLAARLIDAAERASLSELFQILAVEVTKRVYLLLPLQEAGNGSCHASSSAKKKKSKTASGSSAGSAVSAASKLIFALERFESNFLANLHEQWPQSLPRSTSRDFKIVLDNLH